MVGYQLDEEPSLFMANGCSTKHPYLKLVAWGNRYMICFALSLSLSLLGKNSYKTWQFCWWSVLEWWVHVTPFNGCKRDQPNVWGYNTSRLESPGSWCVSQGRIPEKKLKSHECWGSSNWATKITPTVLGIFVHHKKLWNWKKLRNLAFPLWNFTSKFAPKNWEGQISWRNLRNESHPDDPQICGSAAGPSRFKPPVRVARRISNSHRDCHEESKSRGVTPI